MENHPSTQREITGSPPLDRLLGQRWLKTDEAADFVLEWARGKVNLPEESPVTSGIVRLIERAALEEAVTQEKAREVRDEALKALERQLKDPNAVLSFPGLEPPTGWAKVAFAAARVVDHLERKPL